MSYLNPLRLHFAGRFQAAPSTVKNDITHYDNYAFKPAYQQPQQGNQPKGWWNPRGDAFAEIWHGKELVPNPQAPPDAPFEYQPVNP